MNFFYILFLFFLFSCGYPDIDTVPDFKNTILTKEESIDLCKLSNSDTNEISKCISEIDK